MFFEFKSCKSLNIEGVLKKRFILLKKILYKGYNNK